MAAKESEGLIPVEVTTVTQNPVSPSTLPQQHSGSSTMDIISSDSTAPAPAPAPSYEKSQQLYGPSNPVDPAASQPAQSEKAYPGQPEETESDTRAANQYPVHSPSDIKAYPGQPNPNQPHTGQQPQQYYTPYGQPCGYASSTPLHALQSAPAPVDCPCCGRREMTRIEPVAGGTTHGWAAILCFCCCLGCIPYLMSSLKDVDHYCGSCGAKLACWHNSGRVQVMQKVVTRWFLHTYIPLVAIRLFRLLILMCF